MKVAIVGSQNADVSNFTRLLPPDISEIISGGEGKIAQRAQEIAKELQLPLKIFSPDYVRFGENAPFCCNDAIIQYADFLLIFWNGYSPATDYLIDQCKQLNKNHFVLQIPPLSMDLRLDNAET